MKYTAIITNIGRYDDSFSRKMEECECLSFKFSDNEFSIWLNRVEDYYIKLYGVTQYIVALDNDGSSNGQVTYSFTGYRNMKNGECYDKCSISLTTALDK